MRCFLKNMIRLKYRKADIDYCSQDTNQEKNLRPTKCSYISSNYADSKQQTHTCNYGSNNTKAVL